MKLHIHDPGHVALRRGLRAAIGVPLSAALALVLLPKSPAGIVSVFGAFCLIAVCDFGGSMGRKLMSYLGAGAVGAVLVALGVAASQSAVTAVIVTFVIGAVLAFVPVLRGFFTSGAMAMTIMYVVAITAGMPSADVLKSVIGWLLAVVIAIPLALFVLPRRDLAPVRRACAASLLAFADAVDVRGMGGDVDADSLRAARDSLHHAYLGNPFRAAGLNRRERSLVVLAGQVQGLMSSLIHGRSYPTAMAGDATTRRLNEEAARSLRTAGEALGNGGPEPSGLPIVAIWLDQWDETVGTLVSAAQEESEERIRQVALRFPDRAMAVAAIRTVILARRALGLPDEKYPSGPDTPQIPAPVVSRGTQDLRAELTLRSPWSRLALRTGLGLALAVLVVYGAGLAHGLWVVLGVTSVLRFDGLTTMKTAFYAVLGTFAGAAIGYAILATDTTEKGWLWALMVGGVFLAVWVPASIGFALGQASFSIFVIIAVSIMTWPPDVSTATDRFTDVAVGALVSIVVALLLWPGGVLKGTIGNVAEAVRSSLSLLKEAMTSLIVGGEVPSARLSANTTAMLRSQEVVELSLGSPAKGAAASAYEWEALLDHLRNPAVVGRLMTSWAPHHGPIVDVAPVLDEPLQAELHAVLAEWDGVALEIDGGPRRDHTSDAVTIDGFAAKASSLDLHEAMVADRVVAAVWALCWLQMSLRAGQACEVPER